jgi:hypothetical protein
MKLTVNEQGEHAMSEELKEEATLYKQRWQEKATESQLWAARAGAFAALADRLADRLAARLEQCSLAIGCGMRIVREDECDECKADRAVLRVAKMARKVVP